MSETVYRDLEFPYRVQAGGEERVRLISCRACDEHIALPEDNSAPALAQAGWWWMSIKGMGNVWLCPQHAVSVRAVAEGATP